MTEVENRSYEQWRGEKIALFTELADLHESMAGQARITGPAGNADWHEEVVALVKEMHQWFDNNSEAIWESEN